jgi:hypothetical protein
MIQYAWYASGYTDDHPGSFKTVAKVCFSFDATICASPPCDTVPFICCSWCGKLLCFNHFFLDYHFHWFTLVRTFQVYRDTRYEMKSFECFIARWTAKRSATDDIWSNSWTRTSCTSSTRSLTKLHLNALLFSKNSQDSHFDPFSYASWKFDISGKKARAHESS